jgi:hypothetical protein
VDPDVNVLDALETSSKSKKDFIKEEALLYATWSKTNFAHFEHGDGTSILSYVVPRVGKIASIVKNGGESDPLCLQLMQDMRESSRRERCSWAISVSAMKLYFDFSDNELSAEITMSSGTGVSGIVVGRKGNLCLVYLIDLSESIGVRVSLGLITEVPMRENGSSVVRLSPGRDFLGRFVARLRPLLIVSIYKFLIIKYAIL